MTLGINVHEETNSRGGSGHSCAKEKAHHTLPKLSTGTVVGSSICRQGWGWVYTHTYSLLSHMSSVTFDRNEETSNQ